MTIQFNLLPDIKIEYLKARRQQHLVVLGAIAAAIVSITVFVLLISVVYGLQKKNLNDLNSDIKSASNELRDTKDLTKILTVQNQLTVLPGLHDKKVASSRLYKYLAQVTPNGSSITKLDADFTLNTMSISGSASDLATVNKFADSLKFTKYKTKADKTDRNAFTDVVLTGFTVNAKEVTYVMDLKFDPAIFNNTQDVTLTVPQITSTRSEVDKPAALFQAEGEQ